MDIGYLHICCKEGAYDCLLSLISRGGNTDPTDANLVTPLMISILNGKVKLAKTLIELGADIHSK